MDPPLVDEITPFDIIGMMSSQTDLTVDAPHLQPGTSSADQRPLPYQMYHVNSSPGTDFSSSSSGGLQGASTSPELLDGEEVFDYFNNNGLFTQADRTQQEEDDEDRANFALRMAANVTSRINQPVHVDPNMYPTPPGGSEISPQTNMCNAPQAARGSSHGNNSSPISTYSGAPGPRKRARPSSPGMSYCDGIQMQPLIPPQTPHSIGSSSGQVDYRLSPQFHPYERDAWNMLLDDNQQPMNELTLFIHADRGLIYKDRQGAYINYRKTHLQLSVNIECSACEAGYVPKYIYNRQHNTCIPIKEFQVQIHGVRNHNRMSAVLMKQSDKDRKMYPAVFEGFFINKISTPVILRRFHFSKATLHNDQKDGKPNPKQEFFDIVVRLMAITIDDNQHIVQSHIGHKIVCRAGNPRVFGDEDDRSIKEEIDDDQEDMAQTCWACGKNVLSTTGQVVIGGHDPVDNAALTVHGDMIVGAIRQFCDERCKNIYAEKVGEGLKEAYDQLQQLKIFEFSYKHEFATRMGLDPRRRDGFIAQQVRQIIPEAVVEMGDFLSVDQAEIFIKSVSALKHLSSMAEEMQGNLDETMKQVAYILDTVNKKRMASMQSGLNSRRSSISTVTSEKKREKKKVSSEPYQDIFCGSRFSQCTIITVVVALVFVMAACLVSMTLLYFVDLTSRYSHNPVPTVFVTRHAPPENMVVPVNQLAHLQQNVSMLAPKCDGDSCRQYCCDKETIGNATAHMLRENVIVPWRDDENPQLSFGPLNSDVSIYIPELNITLDKSFCVSQSCNRYKREYRLFIPMSPTFPKAPLRVIFSLSTGKMVQLCGEVDGFHQKKCMGPINKDKHIKAREIDEMTFELPVGAYLQSGYKFHVSYSPSSCDPFSLSREDPSRTTEEYNLIFYRKCYNL